MTSSSSTPTFPQADPAIQYIAERVSHIEDASNCTAGYYKNQKDILRRLEKTDEEINRLRGLIEGLDTRDLSRYFKESMDHVVREMQGDVLKALKSGTDPVLSEMRSRVADAGSAASLLDRRFSSMIRALDNAERSLSTTAEKASEEYSEAIRLSESDLLETSRNVLAKYDDLAAKHLALQQRFETLLEETKGHVPMWMSNLSIGLAFGLGLMVGIFLM